MNKVTVIGQGNVASHLCVALAGKVGELINVSSRELEDLTPDSDIYLIAVSDDAIGEVAAQMPDVAGIVAHTAGSVGLDILRGRFSRAGVFYPLQTFTKGSFLDYSEIPVFVEGTDSAVEGELLGLASMFTTHLMKADSRRRERLHIASVFACNFTNCLWGIADSLLKEDDLSIDVLIPLIGATVDKLRYMSPGKAQTGPASRGDTDVVNRHIARIENDTYKDIYKSLSKVILERKHEFDKL